MKVAVLYSGGKDSNMALFLARRNGYDVECLITIKSKNLASYMFHTANIDFVKEQAKSLEIPLIFLETKGEKEKELEDLKKAIKVAVKKYKIEGIVSGALASNYQKNRVDRICKELNLKSIAPLWHKNAEKVLKKMISEGFKILITAVAADGLDESWLGKEINFENLEKLKKLSKKYKFHPCFEGGEAESFVVDGPGFKKRIVVEKAVKKMESECCGVWQIKKVKLV